MSDVVCENSASSRQPLLKGVDSFCQKFLKNDQATYPVETVFLFLVKQRGIFPFVCKMWWWWNRWKYLDGELSETQRLRQRFSPLVFGREFNARRPLKWTLTKEGNCAFSSRGGLEDNIITGITAIERGSDGQPLDRCEIRRGNMRNAAEFCGTKREMPDTVEGTNCSGYFQVTKAARGQQNLNPLFKQKVPKRARAQSSLLNWMNEWRKEDLFT